MTPTFLIAVDVGSDTDLLSIAQEISDLVDPHFPVKSCHPWQQAVTLQQTPPQQQVPPPQQQ